MIRRRPLCLLLTLAQLLCWAGCGEPSLEVRVGAKTYAEQQILGELLAQFVRASKRRVAPVTPCADSFECHQSLRRGRIDLMVDYTGTGLAFIGKVTDGSDKSLARVRELYRPLGLTWLVPLGFDNSYRVVVSTERAFAEKLQTINDLTRLGQGIHVACPGGYLKRPQDGLASLLQRYGLKLAGDPLVIESPAERFQALFDGRADVAIGYATDGAIGRLGLTALEDSLDFFPPYKAVVVARQRTLQRDGALEELLRQLENQIGTKTMRELNYRVQVQGQRPGAVARGFLLQRGLTKPKELQQRNDLLLVADDADLLSTLMPRATRAVKQVFAPRAVAVSRVEDPIAAVAEGSARLALIGAERFFSLGPEHRVHRDARVLALAVVGTRMLHLVAQPGHDPKALLSGRVGVDELGSSSAKAATAILEFTGGQPVHERRDKLLAQAAAGKIAALLLAIPGDASLARSLASDALQIYSLHHPQLTHAKGLHTKVAVRLPYLRPTRLPAGTYRGQQTEIDTLGAQVVLVGPSQKRAIGGGPAAAVSAQLPLNREKINELAEATGVAEAPDPILPSAWSITHGIADEDSEPDSLDTPLNLIAIAFIVWLVFVVLRGKLPPTPEEHVTRQRQR